MSHSGTLHGIVFDKDIDDIRGTTLYGINDEKLGKIDDVIFEHDTGEIKYVVIDTGGWFKHKRFLVPANRIRESNREKEAFQIDLTKERIERTFPKFDENVLKSDPEWEAYEGQYTRLWQNDPVLHQTDRVDLTVTPADVPTQPSGGPEVSMGSLGEEAHEPRPERVHEVAPKVEVILNNEYPVDIEPPANPTQQSKAAHADAGHRNPRMRAFEEVLRKNRVDVTASCASCKPAKDRAA